MGRIKRTYGKSGKERVLNTTAVNSRGYYLANLCKDGVLVSHTAHKLVLETFVGKRPKGMECNHKDGIKINNKLKNLEWITSSKNQKHAYLMGLKKPKRGEASGLSKLDYADVTSIRTLKEKYKYPQKQLAKMFDVSLANIEKIVQGKTWRHLLGGVI